ncbi:MAG: hypothetical protein ACOYWZ_09540 [Bacillota bacterium]
MAQQTLTGTMQKYEETVSYTGGSIIGYGGSYNYTVNDGIKPSTQTVSTTSGNKQIYQPTLLIHHPIITANNIAFGNAVVNKSIYIDTSDVMIKTYMRSGNHPNPVDYTQCCSLTASPFIYYNQQTDHSLSNTWQVYHSAHGTIDLVFINSYINIGQVNFYSYHSGNTTTHETRSIVPPYDNSSWFTWSSFIKVIDQNAEYTAVSIDANTQNTTLNIVGYGWVERATGWTKLYPIEEIDNVPQDKYYQMVTIGLFALHNNTSYNLSNYVESLPYKITDVSGKKSYYYLDLGSIYHIDRTQCTSSEAVPTIYTQTDTIDMNYATAQTLTSEGNNIYATNNDLFYRYVILNKTTNPTTDWKMTTKEPRGNLYGLYKDDGVTEVSVVNNQYTEDAASFNITDTRGDGQYTPASSPYRKRYFKALNYNLENIYVTFTGSGSEYIEISTDLRTWTQVTSGTKILLISKLNATEQFIIYFRVKSLINCPTGEKSISYTFDFEGVV